MRYQVDGNRLLLLMVLLGAGMFVATRLVRPPLPLPLATRAADLASRRIAIRGMLLMTLLGLISGFVGGLAQDAWGDTPAVAVLHALYSICWAPVFLTNHWDEILATSAAWSHVAGNLLGLLGLALVPVFWFGVFLYVGHRLARPRRGR